MTRSVEQQIQVTVFKGTDDVILEDLHVLLNVVIQTGAWIKSVNMSIIIESTHFTL